MEITVLEISNNIHQKYTIHTTVSALVKKPRFSYTHHSQVYGKVPRLTAKELTRLSHQFLHGLNRSCSRYIETKMIVIK